jgi:hypothetical protein
MEKREKLVMLLFLSLVVCISLNSSLVSADLNLRINGQVNGYSSDVWLKVNEDSVETLDNYDFEARSNPSNSSSFYSNITGYNLAIDSWSSTPRYVYLIYSLPSVQSGNLVFTWDSLSSDYEGEFTYYGDSEFEDSVEEVDMSSSSSYTATLDGDSDIYVRVRINEEDGGGSGSNNGNGGDGDDGGGGGGGGAPVTASSELVVNPKSLNIPLILNESKERTIKVQNIGGSDLKVTLEVRSLTDVIEISQEDLSFTLGPKEKRDISVKINAPAEPGIHTGKIIVNGQEVLLSLSVSTRRLLFDAGLVIPDEFKLINLGGLLSSQITLIPMGENPYLDVTLNYLVKDFEGNVYLSESETILITGQKTFRKEFSTKNLPAGDYVLGLELLYPSTNPTDVATSSSHFKIRTPTAIGSYYLFIALILGAGIILLILLFLLIRRNYKTGKRIIRKK